MSQSIIATRYAKGLALHARERGELAKVRQDMNKLADLLAPDQGDISVPELLDFLRSPTVPPHEKIQVTDIICDQLTIGATTSNFLNVLIRKNRIALTTLIARKYNDISGQMEAVRQAEVRTALPLRTEQKQSLTAALTAMAGVKVNLEVKTDPKLIAGILVKLGDKLMDGSVAGRLNRIKAKLTSKHL